jgi:Xaa-Pro aminopeptidase
MSEAKGGTAFDADRLDALMEAAGLDALVVCSKHSVQYMTGGYRYFFFEHAPFIGINRYLPLVVYAKGRPAEAAYIGNRNERDAVAAHEAARGGFGVPKVVLAAYGTRDAIAAAIEHLRGLGPCKRIGIEPNVLPADAFQALRDAFPGAALADAGRTLELLRARKTPPELELLRAASEHVVEAMLATLGRCAPGSTKRDIVQVLREEETRRGLDFEYCLLTVGTSRNRAPSDEVWREGDIISLDSGGNYDGYIGDLCRMGILGDPDSELEDLLAEVDRIQQAARRPLRAGARGGDIYDVVGEALAASAHAANLHFVAHGMGLISHEAPRLTATGPVPYPASDAELPLESRMVLSIETTLQHPGRGFIKLEDTVAVTESGWIGFGDEARGWNRAAGAANPRA